MLSFGKKIKKHWIIVLTAIVFDIVALIPFFSVLINTAFGFILFLYFGPKPKTNSSANLLGIVLPIGIGNVLDWILSFLPVNLGAALVRIYLADDININDDEKII